MAVNWIKDSPAFGGYYEHARVAGKALTVHVTRAGRWVVRVDGTKLRGSFTSAQAARDAALRAARASR